VILSRRRLLAGAAATAAALAARTASADLPTVRVCVIPIEPSCLPYYAQANGFFEKAGINVVVEQNPASPAIAAALVAGSYDVGYATVPTLAEAHAKGLPFKIIAPDGLIGPGIVIGGIVVAAQSTIRTAHDLNGKTFGCSGLKTSAEYELRAWVDKHGGDSMTCKFIEMPFSEIADAIAAGRVDSGYLVEPFLTIATKRNLVRMLATGDDAIAPTYLASAWYATEQWINANPAVVTAFVSSIEQSARWANANPAKVVAIIDANLKVDPTLMAEIPRTVYTDRLVESQIQPWIDITARYGKFPSFPAAELLYRRR
jgi:NitT/TauT family transport system substrate-binding protein